MLMWIVLVPCFLKKKKMLSSFIRLVDKHKLSDFVLHTLFFTRIYTMHLESTFWPQPHLHIFF